MNVGYLWLIPFFPLLGAVLNGAMALATAHRREGVPKALVSWVACLAPASAFVVSVIGFLALRDLPVESRALSQAWFEWIQLGSIHVPLGFLLDPLSSMMLLFVTGIGSLIHLYSVGYMAKERGFARYFAYLNLFMFSMILLVLGDSLVVTFVGWEGVGLCSYLLIGYWHEDPAKAAAGMKAFVVNRIGDFGFLLGMFVIYWTLAAHGHGSLNYRDMQQHAGLLAPVATLAGLLLFLGATGKSAQIPLFTWLPDAMAGPTPVSALIHAATMVTSGIFLLARMNFLYVQSPVALTVVAIVGCATALMAATIGMTQFDIKKVLAYSTVSQLGYMFLGIGVGAFSAGLFHVLTHAFFKALLFLGSGSVIHALSGEQDIRKMGGLLKKIPITSRTFIVGWLAICGIFPFAGFFSKDEILWRTFITENEVLPWLPKLLWFVAFAAAGLTALYMTRLVALTFFGKSRVDEHAAHHLHESPRSMTIPLVLLAVGSAVVGFLGLPGVFHLGNRFDGWLAPVFQMGMEASRSGPMMAGAHEAGSHAVAAAGHAAAPHHGNEGLEWTLMIASLLWAGLGIYMGMRFYLQKPGTPERVAASFGGLYRLARDKYRVDELYDAVVVRPLVTVSRRALWAIVDVKIIDFLVNLVGILAKIGSYGLRFAQTGRVQAYAFVLLLGLLVIMFRIF